MELTENQFQRIADCLSHHRGNVGMRELRQAIQARHAVEFAQAGFFRRLVLRWRIAAEFRRERRVLVPSAHALYSNQIAT